MKEKAAIRMAEKKDTSQILDIYKPYILGSQTSFETEVPSEAAMWERIKKNMETLPWLVCSFKDQVAGYVYATDHRSRRAYQWSKELSLYVHEDYRKKHVGTALYAGILEILALQGVANCLAGITRPNEASVAFHIKHGFNKVGVYHNIGYKMGSWHDVEWWELFIRDKSTAPGKIIPVKELMHTEAYRKALNKGISLIIQDDDT